MAYFFDSSTVLSGISARPKCCMSNEVVQLEKWERQKYSNDIELLLCISFSVCQEGFYVDVEIVTVLLIETSMRVIIRNS